MAARARRRPQQYQTKTQFETKTKKTKTKTKKKTNKQKKNDRKKYWAVLVYVPRASSISVTIFSPLLPSYLFEFFLLAAYNLFFFLQIILILH